MSRKSKTSAPLPVPVARVAPRRKSADQRLRIMERLTSGLSVAHIARAENITVRRVRQIIADMLDKRETDPAGGFAQLQIARLSDAMIVAHTMMMEGNLNAMDRMIKLTGELDRYHGVLREQAPPLAPPEPPRRLAAPEPTLALPGAGEISPGASD